MALSLFSDAGAPFVDPRLDRDAGSNNGNGGLKALEIPSRSKPYNPHSGKILFKTQQQLNRRGFEFSGQNV